MNETPKDWLTFVPTKVLSVIRSASSISTKIIELIVFESRWMLLPMYIGLLIALMAYNVKFFLQLYEMIIHFNSLGETFVSVVLGLVDIVMVGNLIQMITQGSYVIFIRKFRNVSKDDKPQWIEHINAGTLKVKMGASLVGVSSIHLLQDFMTSIDRPWNEILKRCLIHVLFIISTIGLAIADRIAHPPESNSETEKEHQTHN